MLVATASAQMARTLTEVLESGKAATVTPKPGEIAISIRKWNPQSPPERDISPMLVAIRDTPNIRNETGDLIPASRSALESDFLAYAAAAKSAAVKPYLLLEISRDKPGEAAMTTTLECAAATGITDVWVTLEPVAPPRKLPANPVKPVAPRR